MKKKTRVLKKEETTNRIIEAASKVFAEVGFEGARVDEIANEAGVNKATIYYNIGDKEALYTEVIYSVVGANADRIITLIKSMDSPMEKLKFFIESIVNAIFQRPYLANILMREHAGGGKNFPSIVGKDFKKIVSALVDILEEGKKEGIFRDVHPIIVHMHTIGGIALLQITKPVRKKYGIFGDFNDFSVEEITNMFTDFILTSVKK